MNNFFSTTSSIYDFSCPSFIFRHMWRHVTCRFRSTLQGVLEGLTARRLSVVGPTSTLLLRVPRKWGQEHGVILWTTTLVIGTGRKSSKWVGYFCFVFFFR